MKKSLWFSMVAVMVCLSILIGKGGYAETIIESGTTIEDSRTWTEAESPYIVKGSVTIAEGATLTLSAGTKIYVTSYSYDIIVKGTLLSQGTADKGVLETADNGGILMSAQAAH